MCSCVRVGMCVWVESVLGIITGISIEQKEARMNIGTENIN